MSTPVKSGASQASEARAPESGDAEALSRLVTQMQNTVEAEKSALAKELHDELGGLITAAKMDMQWLSARIGGSLDAASDEKFKSVMQMLNQATQEMADRFEGRAVTLDVSAYPQGGPAPIGPPDEPPPHY